MKAISNIFFNEYFLPDALEDAKDTWSERKFEDYEEESDYIKRRGDKDRFLNPSVKGMTEVETETETPPIQIANTGNAIPGNVSTTSGTVNQLTGLTSTEDALLSPTEQLIRKKQRGLA